MGALRGGLCRAFRAFRAVATFKCSARQKQQAEVAQEKPNPLPPGTTATSHSWTYTHTSNEKTVIPVHADDFQEIEGKQHLAGVMIDINRKDGKEYNRVKSAKAEFDMSQGILYSDGDVEITMGVPQGQEPSGRLMVIKSSGVRVERKTGKVSTDRVAAFQFDRGEGKAVGADYDPDTRELGMHSQIELIWRGKNPKGTPMKVEAGAVSYKERDAKVYLSPWSKLTRDTMTLNAGPAVVTLAHGSIKLVETQQAQGTEQRPGRNLEYAAKYLTIDFDDDNQIRKITAIEQARLVSKGDAAITTMTSDRVTMDFDTSGSDSVLQTALATGHSAMESKPVSRPGVEPADTRILKSETIKTKMRPGGKEIESVETLAPGSIEFVPHRTAQPDRLMYAARIALAYSQDDQIQSARAIGVSPRTQKPRAH